MRRKATAVCFALAFCALASTLACDKNPVRGSDPNAMYKLWGRVTEGGFPVPQATVETMASWGGDSKTTDSNGDYSGLMASGDVTLRAQKEGFTAQVKQVTVHENQVVNFELQRADTPGDPQGSYRMIITAAPSCTMLPSDARQRSYSARIDRTQNDLEVTLRDGNFLHGVWNAFFGYPDPVPEAKFAGTRDGSTVRFTIGENEIVERLPSGTLLTYEGAATGTISDSTIVAVFDGTVRIFDAIGWEPVLLAQCQAKDHRMEFVR